MISENTPEHDLIIDVEIKSLAEVLSATLLMILQTSSGVTGVMVSKIAPSANGSAGGRGTVPTFKAITCLRFLILSMKKSENDWHSFSELTSSFMLRLSDE